MLNCFEERPFGVQFGFSVLVFTGSESAGRNTRLVCISFLAKCICMRKWLTAGFFLPLLCPSFCLLLTRHLPVLANRCVPSHASHLAAGSFLLLKNLKAVFAEVLKAVSSFQVTRKADTCNPSENQSVIFWFEKVNKKGWLLSFLLFSWILVVHAVNIVLFCLAPHLKSKFLVSKLSPWLCGSRTLSLKESRVAGSSEPMEVDPTAGPPCCEPGRLWYVTF